MIVRTISVGLVTVDAAKEGNMLLNVLTLSHFFFKVRSYYPCSLPYSYPAASAVQDALKSMPTG